MRTLTLALLLALALPAAANEARVTTLQSEGATVICSEPLQATSYPEASNDYKNPNDTSTLQCSQDGVTGGAIVRTVDGDLTASTNATALAALPAGHSVSRFLETAGGGTLYLGSTAAISSGLVRISARWYKWYSSTFQFKSEGSCENSKHAEFGASTILDVLDSGNGTHINYHTYGYTSGDGWSPGTDGYTSGPSTGSANHVLKTATKGKWWRYEMVITGRQSSSFRMRLYGRNITDDSAEVLLIDTDAGADHPGQTPPALISRMVSNNHRFGTCNGTFGLSHFLLAGWSTDAGQRIGAASEVEGGEAEPEPSADVRSASWLALILVGLTGGFYAWLAAGAGRTVGAIAARLRARLGTRPA